MYGRQSRELGSVGAWDNKAVDPHTYFQRQDRPGSPDDQGGEGAWCRETGEAENLFPRFTHASVTTTGQVTVNGKTLHLWTFGQLETLSASVLRQRANALRDAIGEASCPPIPSSQPQDLIRWILQMQTELTKEAPQAGRVGTTGSVNAMPQSFVSELQSAPQRQAGAGRKDEALPFGPRRGQVHDATRDHYNDLKYQRNEFVEAPNTGIVTNKPGGEGRRHLHQETNMVSFGVSGVDVPQNEGRRYLGCNDHLMEQRKELEAGLHNAVVGRGKGAGPRSADGTASHANNQCSLSCHGIPTQQEEAPIGGERRKHAAVPDRMVNVGVADPGPDESRIGGRRHLDGFAGSKFSQSQEHGGYQSSWKKDPSKLLGTSMIC